MPKLPTIVIAGVIAGVMAFAGQPSAGGIHSDATFVAKASDDAFSDGLRRATERRNAEAVRGYRKAVGQGHARTRLALGDGALREQDANRPVSDVYRRIEANRQRTREIRSRAEQGDAEAQYLLGRIYVSGQLDRPETDVRSSADVLYRHGEAMRWYRRAAEQGNVRAQVALGDKYFYGRLVVITNGRLGSTGDYAQAVRWYGKAAEQGYAQARRMLDRIHESLRLDIIHRHGMSVPRNLLEARRLWSDAAERGNPEAQFALATTRRQAIVEAFGGNWDSARRLQLRWLRMAAEQDFADAQHRLGVMYREGGDLPRDYVRAYMWFVIATEQGHQQARRWRDALVNQPHRIGPDQIAEAEQLAREWIAKRR
ncbi:MAG: sel1 repeat family protein [Salinarimonadaceae bacterium]|nr:MAG: sel1 repeat family protein [Salinarimonadaceae bacterium]